jgi:hypothetical protein
MPSSTDVIGLWVLGDKILAPKLQNHAIKGEREHDPVHTRLLVLERDPQPERVLPAVHAPTSSYTFLVVFKPLTISYRYVTSQSNNMCKIVNLFCTGEEHRFIIGNRIKLCTNSKDLIPCITVVEGGDSEWDTTKPKIVAKLIVVKKNVTCDRCINTVRTQNEELIYTEKRFSDI